MAIEMLDHVRRVDDVDAAVGMGNTGDRVGMANTVGAAELSKLDMPPVDHTHSAQRGEQDRPPRQPYSRRIIVVDPAWRRSHAAADIQSCGHRSTIQRRDEAAI